MAAGHNSVSKEQLKAFIERVENLEAEKKGIADDIKAVLAEAKANGYDVKTIRQIIKLRSQDPNKVAEAKMMLETYAAALSLDHLV